MSLTALIKNNAVLGIPNNHTNHALKTVLHERQSILLNSAGEANRETKQVLVDGDYAYISQGTRGIAIVDISDVTAPVQQGTFVTRTLDPVWHPVYGCAIINNYLFLVSRSSNTGTIEAFDITNKAAPVSIDSDVQVSDFSDIATDGTYLYVAGQQEGVFKYSFDGVTLTLEASLLTGSWETQGVSYIEKDGVGYCVFYNYLYGLRIIDTATWGATTDVTLASRVPSYAPSLRPWKGKRAQINGGDYLFCACNIPDGIGTDTDPTGIAVCNIDDITAPYWVSDCQIETTGDYGWTVGDAGDRPDLSIALYNNEYAFVPHGTHGIAVIDIRNPEHPRYMTMLDNMDTYTGAGGTEKDNCAQMDLYIKNNKLYAISADGTHTPNTEGSDQMYIDEIIL